MSLGGLIPIGGAGGKKPSSSSSGASNLTGGLISISGQKSGVGGGGMGDVDMSDFDVDDLLKDNTTTSSKAKASKASSSPKDKKKKSSSSKSSSNKEKDKASSSTSKKKSKSKKDVMAFDHDDSVDTFDTNVDDWSSKSKSKAKSKSSRWDDDSSEFAAAPVKKKSNLDAEFAKMLGLEDDFASASAAVDDDEGTEDSPMRFGHVGDNGDDNASSAFSSGFGAKTSGGFGDENSDTTTSSFSYEPRVRGGKAKESGGGGSISRFSDGGGNDAVGDRGTYRDPFAKAAAREEDEKDAAAGLSASFFQREDANGDDGDASSLSFLSTTTSERRGGRGGRRGGGGGERAPIEDPFASSQTGYGGGGRSSSTFDSLFDSSRTTKQDGIFGSTRRENSRDEDTDRDHGAAMRVGGDKQQLPQDDFPVMRKTISTNSSQHEDFSKAKDDLLSELFPSEPSSSSRRRDTPAKEDDAPTLFGSSSLGNAKDDLLSELFPSEPSSSSLRTNSATTKKAELSPKEPSKPPAAVTGSGNAKDDLLAELLPSEPPKPVVKPSSRRKGDDEHEFQAKQQDDLLAEISPTAAAKSEKPSSRTVSFNDSESEKRSLNHHDDKKKPDDSESNSQPEKRGASQESKGGATTASKSRKTGGLNDISSARDSLLMDLFPESPPKPQERRRRSNTPSTSPIKEQQQASSPAKDESYSPSRRPSLSPQKSPSRADEQQQSPNRITTSFLSVTPATSNDSSQPQVSPGRAKTLASPSASSIKEVDFEQSKDSLLEELLSPSRGSKSPASSPFRGGSEAQHRISYSQSFEDEKDESVGDQRLQHRRRSSFAASSPLRSPENVAVSEAPRDQAASSVPAGSRASLDKASPVDRSSSRRSGSPPSPAQDQILYQHQISSELLEASLKKREEELRVEHEAVRAALATTHEGELLKLHAMIAELTQQLHDERSKSQTLTAENMQQQARLKLLEQENQLFLQQVANFQAEKCQLQQDLHSVQAQHALCATQSTLFQSERTGFLNQVKNLEDQSRQLVHQLSQEKQDHQATQLRFASFQQEREQEAQLLKQKEAHQMTKLFQQLQTSLVSLKMLQEQVVDDEVTKHEVENESRLRMITSLETSSRKCAKQTEEECFRLASLLGNLETTLRHYRQEHLEEKERLRQEQLRLNVLASHFQVQTTAMHEKADANTQMLAQYFTSSMQDVRVAESRLAARRQNLEDEEKQLYDERTRFAVYREEFLQQQAREAQKMQSERLKLDKTWKELQRERDDLDDVIASHEEDFQMLQQLRGDLEQEKENIEYRAMQVADMARKFEGFTQQLLAREEEIAREKQEIETWKHEFASKQQHVSSEKQKLDERELRLHSQLKQMEKSRRRLNDQRKQHLIRSTSGSTAKSQLSAMNPLAVHDLEQAKQRLMEYTRYMGAGGGNNQAVGVDNNRKWRGETSSATHSTSNQTTMGPASNWSSPQPQRTNHTAPQPPRAFTPNADPPVWKDPSGLSSSFRELVEENWKKCEWSLDVANAALHKERMWINCIGLNTTPVSGAETAAPSSRQQQHQQQNSGASVLKPSKGSNVAMSGTKHNQQQQQQYSIPTRQAQSTLPPPPPHPQLGRQSIKRSVTIDL